MTPVATIVLAAGSSTRMGRNKMLLELGGATVARRAVRTACGAALGPVVVVTGRAHGAVAAEFGGLKCRTVVNHDHEMGQHSSVRAGALALPPDSAAAIVMLADMPFVTSAMLRTLARRHRETGAALVVSRYGDEGTAPPILYDRRLFGELASVDHRCGRRLMRRHRKDAVEVAWPPSAIRDLDRPADYEAVRRERAGAAVAENPVRAASAAPTHIASVRHRDPSGDPSSDSWSGRPSVPPGTARRIGPLK